jgi:hypothetical protein
MADDVADNQIQLEGPGSAAPQEPEQPGSPRKQQHDRYKPDLGSEQSAERDREERGNRPPDEEPGFGEGA